MVTMNEFCVVNPLPDNLSWEEVEQELDLRLLAFRRRNESVEVSKSVDLAKELIARMRRRTNQISPMVKEAIVPPTFTRIFIPRRPVRVVGMGRYYYRS